MRIIKGTEAILVAHPVFLIFGQPGIGKSSLGYSMREPLTLDFDHGAHRAANRRDTLAIDTWKDVAELMENPSALAPYESIAVDTVGRCLDVLTVAIIAENPKLGPGGNLSQQGWGTLKSRFRTWVAALRALNKDVLLIAHDKEDKDGDVRIVRPDIVGGSFAEVLKVADFVGYMQMNGRARTLDFNPTDRSLGKNPAGWAPLEVPPVAKAQAFMAELIDSGREALGNISEESARVAQTIREWSAVINGYGTADAINGAIPEIAKLPPISAPQIKKILMERAGALGLTFDKKAKKFAAPSTDGAGATAA